MGTLLTMMILMVFIGLLMLVVNYTYLAYSQLRTADVTDTLARTAVSELQDTALLEPGGLPIQNDDILAAENVVKYFVDQLNAAAAANQQLRYDPNGNPGDNDITVTAGWVADLSKPVTSATFLEEGHPNIPAGSPLNTLRVEASRPKNGQNPVYLLIRGLFAPQTADIGSASYATLDSRLVGFQPTALVNTPVVPIALDNTSWQARAADVNGAGPTDFVGQMKQTGGAGVASITLVNFRDIPAPVNYSEIEDQIRFGTTPLEVNINGGDLIGPVVPGTAITLDLPAEFETPPVVSAQTLATALNDVAASDDPRRIFPLYDNPGSDRVEIVGFVAARILEATYNNQTLELALEPDFVVHYTAVTMPVFNDGINNFSVPENVYIQKLRLSR